MSGRTRADSTQSLSTVSFGATGSLLSVHSTHCPLYRIPERPARRLPSRRLRTSQPPRQAPTHSVSTNASVTASATSVSDPCNAGYPLPPAPTGVSSERASLACNRVHASCGRSPARSLPAFLMPPRTPRAAAIPRPTTAAVSHVEVPELPPSALPPAPALLPSLSCCSRGACVCPLPPFSASERMTGSTDAERSVPERIAGSTGAESPSSVHERLSGSVSTGSGGEEDCEARR